jgi:hypothetical protein
MSTRKLLAIAVLLCVAGTLLMTTAASAQEVTASIVGTVTDSSGSAIKNATVTATDTERGTVRTVQTNDVGGYNLTRLPVSSYTVRVEAQGFQSSVYPAFTLVLNQTARIDVAMKVGQVSETVEVTGAAPILKTESAQLDTIIDARTNVSLPLASRNYVQLTLLAPGSVNPNPQTLTNAQRIDGAGRPYINGNREQSNNFLLDGMDNNQVSDNLVGYTPSVDAIQEFNMITQNASAEFGNFEGGIVNTTIKSGTNSFHGTAFEFFRNDKLNANQWQNGFGGPGNELEKPKLRWNMFGAAIGGPIVKNKLFFFADYQGQRFDHPSTTNHFTVLTDAERNGDFSALGVQLYNPFNVVGGVRQPFVNNQIPTNLFNPVAVNLLASQFYPHATLPGLQDNATYISTSALNVNQGDFKVDWNASDKDRVFGRFSEESQENPSTNSVPIIASDTGHARIHNGVLNWTHSINPSLMNEVRVGANYVGVDTINAGTPASVANLGEDLGITGANIPGPGLLALNFTGGNLTNIGGSGVTQLFHDTVFQYGDNLIITHGQHTLHAGAEFQRIRVNSYYSGNNGQMGLMDFTGKFTGATGGGSLGVGEADFLLGLPDDVGRGVPVVGGKFPTWGHRGNTFAGYVQDDWKVTPHLTLNIGLRYEIHTPWVEVQDRQANFGLISGDLEAPDCSKVPIALPSYVPCHDAGNRALYNTYNGLGNWQPRVGFAWNPEFLGGKTVIRAAYTTSTYLEGTGTNLRLPLNPPFTPAEISTPPTTTNLPSNTTDQGIPLAPPSNPFLNATIRLWDPHVQPAIAQQWNLSVQRELTNDTTLQVAYVGQRGTHLMVPTPYLQKQLQPDGTITNSPFFSGNPTLQASIGQISGTAAIGSMDYHALQATLQRRFASGLQFQVAYTYSKCLTDSSGYYGSWGGQTTPTSPYFQNLYDTKAEWGPCYYDAPHTLSSYVTYELPIGHGKRMGSNMNPVLNGIIGNWQISGIVSLHSGFPLTISAADNSGTNSRGARADCNGQPHYPEQTLSNGHIQWFDASIYSQPGSGFGTCGVGTVRGPGLATGDLGLQKDFLLTEKKKLEFRAEFINVANHPILNSPDAGFGSTLGQVSSAQGERNIQLALKFSF